MRIKILVAHSRHRQGTSERKKHGGRESGERFPFSRLSLAYSYFPSEIRRRGRTISPHFSSRPDTGRDVIARRAALRKSTRLACPLILPACKLPPRTHYGAYLLSERTANSADMYAVANANQTFVSTFGPAEALRCGTFARRADETFLWFAVRSPSVHAPLSAWST